MTKIAGSGSRSESGSTPKCHGSATLVARDLWVIIPAYVGGLAKGKILLHFFISLADYTQQLIRSIFRDYFFDFAHIFKLLAPEKSKTWHTNSTYPTLPKQNYILSNLVGTGTQTEAIDRGIARQPTLFREPSVSIQLGPFISCICLKK
jgi:hypothetical protein